MSSNSFSEGTYVCPMTSAIARTAARTIGSLSIISVDSSVADIW